MPPTVDRNHQTGHITGSEWARPVKRHITALQEGCPEFWTWNQLDRSHEVKLKGNNSQVAYFHPNWSNGTAGVRGTKVLNDGVHYWEICISQRIFGTSMMFGIGTRKARLHADAFLNLIGEDEHSWGLSHKGLIWHNNRCTQYCRAFRENEETTIGLLLDWGKGTLTYYKDGTCLGVAFKGLNEMTDDIYPMVCSTAAKTEMCLGVALRNFGSLQDRCRGVIAQFCQNNEVDQLPLPSMIKTYIKEMLST